MPLQRKVIPTMFTDIASHMSAARTHLQSWRPDTRTLLLVIGDALAFLVFAAIGRKTHQEAAGLAALGQIAWTAAPFALGWFVVAPFLGAFRRAQTERPERMLKRTELAWLAAWPLALLLRWALSADHQVPPSFALVILLANAVLLGAWRTVFALVATRLPRVR